MAGSYRYALGPVIEAETVGIRHYAPHDGCISWIDLRNLPSQSTLGNVASGFFTMPSDWTVPSGYHWLAESQGPGDCRSLYLTVADQDAWQSLIGVRPTRTPSTTLIDALDETLTTLADPTGETLAKPLVPCSPPPGPPLEAQIILGGHSTVRRKELAQVGRWWNNIQSLHRRDLDAYATERGNDDRAWRKLAGCLAQKYHGRWDDIRGNAFLPQRLKSDRAPSNPHAPKSGRIWAMRPETTLTESFNGADSATFGVDLTWTELRGDMQVVSNQGATSGSGGTAVSRAEHDVSSSDHYSQATVAGVTSSGGTLHLATCSRFSSSAETYYMAYKDATNIYVFKTVAAVSTQLGSFANANTSGVIKSHNNGSTIQAFWAGVSEISLTDTAIASGTRGGVQSFDNLAVSNGTWDDWSLVDLAAATVYSNLLLLGVG